MARLRLKPRQRKLVVAAHVVVSGAWLGVVLAKLTMVIAVIDSGEPGLAAGAAFIDVLDSAVFPRVAVATALTGVIVSVGTKWGLFTHYWVVAKMLLTVAVIVTGVGLAGAPAGGAAAGSLVAWAAAHLVMLGAATVISVLKPWGRTRPRRRAEAGRPQVERDSSEIRRRAEVPSSV